MRAILLALLLCSCSEECYFDRECPDAGGGWCEVPARSCAAPFVSVCREMRCVEVCPCSQ